MAFTLDASADADAHVGGDRVEPGLYHVIVEKVDETQSEYASILIDFRVLAGTTADQAGKMFREFFATTDKAAIRLKRLALVTGLLKPKTKASVEFTKAVGTDLIVKVVDHEYEKDGEKKKTTQLDFLGMWKVGHADVKHCPLGEVPKPKRPDFDL